MLMKTQLKKTWYLGIQCPGKHRNFPNLKIKIWKRTWNLNTDINVYHIWGPHAPVPAHLWHSTQPPIDTSGNCWRTFCFPQIGVPQLIFFCELRLLAKFPNYRKTLLVVAIMFCLQHQRAAPASNKIWNMELILTKAFAKCITYQQMAQQTTHQMAHQHHIKMDNPDMIAVALNRQWFMVIISYNKVKKSKCFSVHLEISII